MIFALCANIIYIPLMNVEELLATESQQ